MAKLVLISFVTTAFVPFSPTSSTTTPATFPIITCAEGWMPFEDHCYLVVTENKTWDKASDHCGVEDSYLVEINTAEERDFVFILLSNYDLEMFWIGATYRVCKGKFRYRSTGELVPDYWAVGHPCQAGENQWHCASMMPLQNEIGVELYSVQCCNKHKFVCEKS